MSKKREFPILNGKLISDLDANGHKIIGADIEVPAEKIKEAVAPELEAKADKTELEAETQRATGVEATLGNAITAEVTRATKAEAALDKTITEKVGAVENGMMVVATMAENAQQAADTAQQTADTALTAAQMADSRVSDLSARCDDIDMVARNAEEHASMANTTASAAMEAANAAYSPTNPPPAPDLSGYATKTAMNEVTAAVSGVQVSVDGKADKATTLAGYGITDAATNAELDAIAAWLKKNKVGSFESVGGASATVENGVAKLDNFFTESNSLLTGTIDAEVISKGTAPDAHLEAPTDERLKLVLADNSVAYDSEKALPYKLTSAIGDRVIATMTLTAASTDITLPTIAANDTTVKDFILDVTNAYAVEGVATDAGINIPRTDFKLVTRYGESLTDVTTVKAGKSAFLCFTQKSPVVVDGTTYPCWCVIQLPFGDPS